MTYDEMKKMLGNGFNQKDTIEVLQMLQGKRLKVFIDAYKEKPLCCCVAVEIIKQRLQ